jgi:hypothetical protein
MSTAVVDVTSMPPGVFMTVPNSRPEGPPDDSGERLHERAFGGDERNHAGTSPP